jgi:fatty-acyl-CoA synthase
MMDVQLTLPLILRRAERVHPDRALVSHTTTGVERTTYGEVAERARRLASALARLGVGRGDRVATFAWNSSRHLEAYFAVPCMGAVLHTLNIRLFEDQLAYVVNHAQDRVVLCDASLAHVFARIRDRVPGVEHVVLLPDAPDDGAIPGALHYEELLVDADAGFGWPTDLREGEAAAMCYTSGTTGDPKGVLYSHRSTLLHMWSQLTAEAGGATHEDIVQPVVPMFHANAWGIPYAATAVGSSLVLPGPAMAPEQIAEQIARERVTVTAGVPTIWLALLRLEPSQLDLSSLRVIHSGGSAVPESLIRAYWERFRVPFKQGWGMTETSPVATTVRGEPEEFAIRATQGRALAGVELRIVDDDGTELPWDGEAVGELEARGPWIARAYYDDPRSGERFSRDGWLRTGDVASFSPQGDMRIVDRTKDLVKSGGEWISSVELEGHVMAHPDVAEAAVIAVPDERWQERPAACVVPREGADLDAEALRAFLAERVARWWIPERIEFLDELPKTSVGKFDKRALRARFVPDAASANR